MKYLLFAILSLFLQNVYSQYPGGTNTNLRFWLKANVGVSCVANGCGVSSWQNNISIVTVPDSVFNATNSTQPILNSTSINYNPTIDFSFGDRLFSNPDKGIIPYTVAVESLNFFAVCESNSDEGTIISDNFSYSAGNTADQGWQIGVGNDRIGSYATAINSIDFRSEIRDEANANYFENTSANTLTRDTPHIIFLNKNFTSTPQTKYFSDMLSLSKNSGGLYTVSKTIIDPIGSRVFLGESDDSQSAIWSPNFVGKMAEIITYDRVLTSLEQLKVHSYLGVKYGLTINRSESTGNYLNSLGNTVYVDGGVSTYWNDIIGVMRDDDNALLQKQSHQSNDSTRVYISTLQNSNLINNGTFSTDLQSIVMGHNNAPMSSKGSTEFPALNSIYSRIEREWKIKNTGFNGTFSIDMTLNTSPLNSTNLRVMIDTDGNFADAIIFNPTISVTGTTVTISGIPNSMIPLNTIRYLTIVSINSSTPLPINLLNFNATILEDNYVNLKWQTASETNNDYFTLERSVNVNNWEEVAIINGAGNSSTSLSYSANDKRPYTGVTYYRLKQTDFDGKFEYSKIRSVDIKTDNSFKISPNPANNQITITGKQIALEEITIYNTLGQNITKLTQQTIENDGQLVIDLSKLNSGIYYIKTKTTANKVYKQ